MNFGTERTTVERHPLKKRNRGIQRKMVYKYPRARKFFLDMSTLYSVKELLKLLVAGVQFPDLGLVKIEVNHLVSGVDSLLNSTGGATPGHLGCFCIPRAIYRGDWGADYIRAAFVNPDAVASTSPSPGATTLLAMEPTKIIEIIVEPTPISQPLQV